jgi:hypothetical protein
MVQWPLHLVNCSMQSLCALRRNLLWHLDDAGFSGFWASFLLVLCWLPGWNRVYPRHSNHVCTCTPLLGLLGDAYVPDMAVSVLLAFQDKVCLSVRKSALLPYVAHPQCRCRESLSVAARHSGHILIVVWPYFCTVVLVSSDCLRWSNTPVFFPKTYIKSVLIVKFNMSRCSGNKN